VAVLVELEELAEVQLVKAVLPPGELELDGQALHVELAEASVAVEYVPAPQAVHIADPVNTLYFPATHAVHVPPSGPDQPALQVQWVKDVLCAGELEPAGQIGQSVDPAASLYFPSTQAAHGPPFAPENPALQVQLDKVVLCGIEVVFAGHAKQVDEPNVIEYVPLSQALQTTSLLTSLYLPATHAVQVPPSFPQYPELQVQLANRSLLCAAFELSGHAEHTRCDEFVHTVIWNFPALHGMQFGLGITGSMTKVVRCVHMQVTCVELMRCAVQPSGRYELLTSSQ
jgi:hypothetical protein